MSTVAAILFGILIGWLIEWAVDYAYWRRRVRTLEAENARLRAQLAASPHGRKNGQAGQNAVEVLEAGDDLPASPDHPENHE